MNLRAKGGARLIASLLLALSFLTAAEKNFAQTFSQSGFSTELVATFSPYSLVGMAWAPDGRLFVWQKNGVVRVIKQGVLLATPFIDLSAQVNSYDDRGFWGLAFHPNFATNGFVYFTYTYENANNPNDSAPRTSRLTRVTANPANPDVALPGSEVVILGSIGTPPCSAYPVGSDCIAADGGSHTIGTVRFGSDGKLFVGVGDGADVYSADPNALRAQDLGSWNGKILRINEDGSAPSDNPFYDGTNSIRSKVWLYGVRNPFRFAQHPTTGELYFGEVGWNTWEEVNRGIRGANYGWPCYEGDNPQPFYQSGFQLCQQLPASAVVRPIYTYDHSFGSAAIGGAFYTATLYPSQYLGNFFFADYSGNWIQRVVFDASGAPQGVQPFATNVPAPVGVELGPDGMLYYLSFTSGQIRRIRYNGVVAAASATPSSGYSPLTVSFSSAGSSDPGGGPLTFLWDFGDATTSTQPNPTHTYNSASVTTFTARLTVTNSASQSASKTVNITLGSTPPTPTILAPQNGVAVLPGQSVTFQGSATDPEQGALPSSALSWTVLLHHNSHVHTHINAVGSGGSFVVENHGSVGTYSYEVVLTATDSSGLQASTSVLLPVAADTTLPSAPSSLTATAGGAGQISLTWTASTDNVGVTGYFVERCQGAGCTNFAQVGSTTNTSYSDSGLTAGASYSYRVQASDAANNLSGYSNIATATVSSAPPVTGLVAAYGFNTGSGSTAVDASGNGNSGIITGATWSTQGRYGGALSFNGIDNVVRVASSASLNVSAAMTLEAWIQPAVSQSGWRTILQRETDAYFLNASNSNGPLFPSGGGTFGATVAYVSGNTGSPVNAWTHVALTYDGAQLRLYVNGALAASTARTGAVQTNSNALWIGGNSPYGEYFQGLIDELRIYNRALSQAEIQTDMSTPIDPIVPDSTAPNAPGVLTASVLSDSQINLSWTASTDNVGVTGYLVERCQGAGCTSFAQVGTPSGASYSDAGLTASTSYSYRVRARDAAGNLSAYSNVVSATTSSPDTQAPSAPSALAASVASATQINLTWTASTDNVGVTGYFVERCQGAGCTSFAQVGTPSGASYSDPGLTASTSYSYRVRARDAAGNLSAYSSVASATTSSAPDTQAPSVPSALAASVASSTQINLSWTASTDNVAVTGYFVERCQGAGCTSFTQVGTPSGPSYTDTGLTASTSHSYRVRARDAAGNLSAYSNVASATTSGLPPSNGPVATYAFSEGVGTTVADLSGNGNTGTIVNGATWTTLGKYGSALNFDGVNDMVEIPGSSSLNVSSAMTLMAWIYPTASQTGWRTILQREVDAYFLNAGNNAPLRPAGGGTFGSTVDYVSGQAANPVNAWTHVTLSYDGANMRLYVNGTQVAIRARTGAIETNNKPLRIGGNVPYGEFFRGSIDEVRIYNRALSVAEVQAAMNTPLQ